MKMRAQTSRNKMDRCRDFKICKGEKSDGLKRIQRQWSELIENYFMPSGKAYCTNTDKTRGRFAGKPGGQIHNSRGMLIADRSVTAACVKKQVHL